jgi:hypothetical protein
MVLMGVDIKVQRVLHAICGSEKLEVKLQK